MQEKNKAIVKKTIIKKSEIVDKDGKLNTVGTFMVIAVTIKALTTAFNYLEDLIEDDTEETNSIE